jgi:hypothetical protein
MAACRKGGDLIRAYQKCVAETVQRFGGFVAKYMGDGVLVYFGYPHAHEDDALHNNVPMCIVSGRYPFVMKAAERFHVDQLEFLDRSHPTYGLRPKLPLEVTFGFYSPSITFCYPGGEGPLNHPAARSLMRVSHPSSQRTTGLCTYISKFRNNTEPLLPLQPRPGCHCRKATGSSNVATFGPKMVSFLWFCYPSDLI